MSLIAVNYHYVRPSYDDPHPGIYGITPAQLKAQIQLLLSAAPVVGVNELIDAVEGKKALPTNAWVLTFDDGFREQVEHALPVLDDVGVPGIFYVNTDPIEREVVCHHHKLHLMRAKNPNNEVIARLMEQTARIGVDLGNAAGESTTQYRYDDENISRLKYQLNLGLPAEVRDQIVEPVFASFFPGAEREMSRALYMDRAQLKLLAARGCLANHGHQHLPLGLLPPTQAASVLRTAQDKLEQWTGFRPRTYSYPFGSRSATSSAVGAAAAAMGNVFGFTMERAKNSHLGEPVHLARMDTNDVPGGKSCTVALSEFFERSPERAWYANA
jgi:peptidoglycan/xylan/chitin deacetylase (PgdA/CDA1 family)